MKFPKEFLLGASTAAHQVEGNNRYSDLWAQEQMEHSSFAEPSNDAVDHYHRYEEDIALLAGAGLNAYRFSIEWARVEPQEGCFDESELEHYRKVIRCCRERGVEPVVTLHHFSSPKWLIERGGWEAESTVDYFKRYAVKVVEALGDELHYICTINEANMGLQIAAISKRYMMQMQKAAAARAAAGQAESSVQMGMNLQKMLENRKAAAAESLALFGTENPQTFQTQRTPEGDLLIMRAHAAARDAIKAICPELKLGLTLSLTIYSRSRVVRHWPPRSGTRNLPTICPTSRTMIFWACRTTPAPALAPMASCLCRKARSLPRWAMSFTRRRWPTCCAPWPRISTVIC